MESAAVGRQISGATSRRNHLSCDRSSDLEKNALKPWQTKAGVIPPKANAEFVYHMEDVLELYAHPYDPKRPVICMDEANRQLISEVTVPLKVKPGHPAKYDAHYKREGVCNLFLFVEPLRGGRQVLVREQRTKKDWVQCLTTILEQYWDEIEMMRVVLDNLNSHTPAAFYEVYEPAKAKRLLSRLEFHYTPTHASWLNIAEIELSVLVRQCLKQRISSQECMKKEVTNWSIARNQAYRTVDWQFTTKDARIKLKRLYPSYLP
jgi:hypothetical protein